MQICPACSRATRGYRCAACGEEMGEPDATHACGADMVQPMCSACSEAEANCLCTPLDD